MPVDALVVNMRRRGPGQMLGLDNLGDATGLLDNLTGGEYTSRMQQLDRLELALKVSIVASCIAGIAGLASLLSRKG
jgi:hypothetical protein